MGNKLVCNGSINPGGVCRLADFRKPHVKDGAGYLGNDGFLYLLHGGNGLIFHLLQNLNTQQESLQLQLTQNLQKTTQGFIIV